MRQGRDAAEIANPLELELLPCTPHDMVEDVGELLGGRASAKWL